MAVIWSMHLVCVGFCVLRKFVKSDSADFRVGLRTAIKSSSVKTGLQGCYPWAPRCRWVPSWAKHILTHPNRMEFDGAKLGGEGKGGHNNLLGPASDGAAGTILKRLPLTGPSSVWSYPACLTRAKWLTFIVCLGNPIRPNHCHNQNRFAILRKGGDGK